MLKSWMLGTNEPGPSEIPILDTLGRIAVELARLIIILLEKSNGDVSG